MNFIKQIEKIKKAHQLIQGEKTGNPDEFAKALRMSRSQIYNVIDILKDIDAPIKYSRKQQSFYYEKAFDLELLFTLKTITDQETKEIFGGFSYRPILLDGTLFSLP